MTRNNTSAVSDIFEDEKLNEMFLLTYFFQNQSCCLHMTRNIFLKAEKWVMFIRNDGKYSKQIWINELWLFLLENRSRSGFAYSRRPPFIFWIDTSFGVNIKVDHMAWAEFGVSHFFTLTCTQFFLNTVANILGAIRKDFEWFQVAFR